MRTWKKESENKSVDQKKASHALVYFLQVYEEITLKTATSDDIRYLNYISFLSSGLDL